MLLALMFHGDSLSEPIYTAVFGTVFATYGVDINVLGSEAGVSVSTRVTFHKHSSCSISYI